MTVHIYYFDNLITTYLDNDKVCDSVNIDVSCQAKQNGKNSRENHSQGEKETEIHSLSNHSTEKKNLFAKIHRFNHFLLKGKR